MIGFHIDMNVAQFKGDYLEKWLEEFALRGYDTILWEVENNVEWETCPECVSPDAFSKKDFKHLLGLCRNLGLEPIPLLQTIGHAEYVLKHDEYKHLREVEDGIEQYCPRNGDVLPFLKSWIDEYFDLFGDIRYFHLGADEAGQLGKCRRCSDYVGGHSVSELYVEHMNAVCAPVIERSVTPAIRRRWRSSLARSCCSTGVTISITDRVSCRSGERGGIRRRTLPRMCSRSTAGFFIPSETSRGRSPIPSTPRTI
jgi:hexosaminidase